MTLQKRTLGQTGLKVSCLGLGTVKLGRNQEVKYPSPFALPSDQDASSLLALAHDLGVNLLDTAPAYGSSEQRIGRLLQDRQDWIICSKVGEEFLNGKSFYDFSAKHTRHSVERSLRNLATDYLDIVLIHSDGNDSHILESSDCLETLLAMKCEGLIRAVGMSTKTVEGGLKAVAATDMVMVTYNPSMTEDAVVIDEALAQQKGVLIKKALNSGHDCGNSGSSKSGENSTETNLSFVLSKEGVTSAIIGTINPDHLKANIAAAEKVLA